MQALTNRSKRVSNKKLSLGERLYLPAVIGGLGITIKHFFKKKVTIQYPEEQRPMSEVYRGLHVLKRDEQGRERCTACGLCAVACPAEAISMTAAERQPGEENLYREEKYAAVYEINMLRCIFCGLCEEACPKSAIYLQSDKLAPSFYSRADVIYGKDRLVQSMETIKTAKSLKSGLTTSDRYVDKVWKNGKY
jgi:NADH-quinone oxidoreductase subunit I